AQRCAPQNALERRWTRRSSPETGPTRGEAEPPPPPGSHRLRARARHLAAPIAQALLGARARAAEEPRSRGRVRPAAARSEHLGPALARGEDRHRVARHARAGSAPRAHRRRDAVTSASVPLMVRLPVWRARIALAALLGAFVLLAARSAYLQSMKHEFLQE